MNKKDYRRFYIEYSLLFLMLAGLIVFFYYSRGKNLIDYSGDGFRQHFRALAYYAEHVRQILRNIFIEHTFIIPQWDFSIAEGNDIIQTFHYYGLGDIFAFFSFLVPGKYMNFYYDFAIFARMYASGIAFSCLCFYLKRKNRMAVLTGSILYAFNSFSVSALSSHVFFISAAVFLPLIILGVEKVFHDDKPYLLSIAVFLSAISNVYFFYMNVLSTVIYSLIRMILAELSVKEKIGHILKIALYSFIGVMLSAFIFLPMFYAIFSGSRMGSEIMGNDLFYPAWEYRAMVTNYVFGCYGYYGGFSILMLPATVELFIGKDRRTLKILYVLGAIFLAIPFFSRLYNAMIYANGRWNYALNLLAIFIITDTFEDVQKKGRNYMVYLLFTICYFAFCLYTEKHLWQIHAMYLIVAVALILFVRFVKNKKLSSLACLLCTVFCISFSLLYSFSPRWWDYPSMGTDFETIRNMDKEEHSVFDKIDDDSFFRYSGEWMTTNQTIQGKHSSTQYYWSVANSYVVDFRKQIGLSDNNNHHYSNYDDRFALNNLACVKYFIKDREILPYGFSYLGNYNGHEVYKNQYNLPLVYAYDSYLTREQWDELSLSQKNESLLLSCVTRQDFEGFGNDPLSFEQELLDCKKTATQGLLLDDGLIKVESSDAELILSADHDRAGEYYLLVENLNSDTNSNIIVSCNENRKILFYKGPYHSANPDKHYFMINLGYFNEFHESVNISFPDEGEFRFDSIELLCQPLEKQIEAIDRLKKINIDSLNVGTNEVRCALDLDDDKLICFAIPYSEGWKAYVDGQKTELSCFNIQYMGLPLSEGRHEIRLTYSTPLFHEGMAISLAGCVILTALWLKERRYNKMR